MKLSAVALLAMLALAAAQDLTDTDQDWEDFKAKFKKTFKDSDEEANRHAIFSTSIARINKLNQVQIDAGGEPCFGVTFMADRLGHEKHHKGRLQGPVAPHLQTVEVLNATAPAPKKVDWRKTRAVTPIKNQGQCGSCWAFSTAETVESGYFLKTNIDTPHLFSAQQINSCTAQETQGCGGGFTQEAFQYLAKEKNGLADESFWEYAQGLTPLSECSGLSCTQPCKSHNLTELATYAFYIGPAAPVSGFKYASPYTPNSNPTAADLEQLSANLASEGPVSICVDAGAWDDYTGGVLSYSACGPSGSMDLDHCVQLVGYDATASPPYWLVRNSWATDWGEDGYIRLEYGKNTCGLADEATVATFHAPSELTDEDEKALKQRFANLQRISQQ